MCFGGTIPRFPASQTLRWVWSKPHKHSVSLYNHRVPVATCINSQGLQHRGAAVHTRPSIMCVVTVTAVNAGHSSHHRGSHGQARRRLTQFPCIEPSPSSECTSLPQHAYLKCSNRTTFRLNWRQNPQRGRQETQWPAMNAVKPFEPHRAH